jgi:hypothetical protein
MQGGAGRLLHPALRVLVRLHQGRDGGHGRVADLAQGDGRGDADAGVLVPQELEEDRQHLLDRPVHLPQGLGRLQAHARLSGREQPGQRRPGGVGVPPDGAEGGGADPEAVVAALQDLDQVRDRRPGVRADAEQGPHGPLAQGDVAALERLPEGGDGVPAAGADGRQGLGGQDAQGRLVFVEHPDERADGGPGLGPDLGQALRRQEAQLRVVVGEELHQLGDDRPRLALDEPQGLHDVQAGGGVGVRERVLEGRDGPAGLGADVAQWRGPACLPRGRRSAPSACRRSSGCRCRCNSSRRCSSGRRRS